MSNLIHRDNTLFVNGSDGKPTWGASYEVTVYPVGGEVSSATSGTTINLYAGHSFKPNDKFLRNPGTDDEFSGAVSSVTATTIVMGTSFTVAVGDQLVNLGPDGGTTTPNYDGSPVPIYADPTGSTTALTNSTITADSTLGTYEYYYRGDGRV